MTTRVERIVTIETMVIDFSHNEPIPTIILTFCMGAASVKIVQFDIHKALLFNPYDYKVEYDIKLDFLFNN